MLRPLGRHIGDYVDLHTDPRTYQHKPAAMPSPERCVERFDADLAAWERDGVGYGPVVLRDSGRTVGWAGLRVELTGAEPHLNLYFRLAAEAIGHGHGREIARGLAAWATEHRADLPLEAVVAPVNEASLRTSRSAGLVEVRREVHPLFPDDEPDVILRAPTVRVVRDVEGLDALEESALDVWTRVNDAGGAVGFLPGAPRAEVAEYYRWHGDRVLTGEAVMVALVDPLDATRVWAFGYWHVTPRPIFAHVADLRRLMVDPARQSANVGRLAMAAMVGVARRDLRGVELLQLDYRSGLGLGTFYASLGWTEVGRIPRSLRVGPGDDRDDVIMVRRLDGGPLAPDGRL